MKIGYDRKLTTEINQELTDAGTTKNYSRIASSQTDLEYFEDFLRKHNTQEIIIKNLDSIGLFTTVQLNKVLSIIEEKSIKIIFLQSTISGLEIKQNFLEVLRAFVSHDKTVIVNRTTKGLEMARSEGRIGGRPKLSKNIQNQIKKAYFNEKKSYRKIAEELNISIGTVHKYVNL